MEEAKVTNAEEDLRAKVIKAQDIEEIKAKVVQAQDTCDLDVLEEALREAKISGADPAQIEKLLAEVNRLKTEPWEDNGGPPPTPPGASLPPGPPAPVPAFAETPLSYAEAARLTGHPEAADEAVTRRRLAQAHKQRGNEVLRSSGGVTSRPVAKEAWECFTAGLEVECDDARLVAQLYSNRAHVQMQLRQFVEAVDDCRKAIASDPNFVKAYWRAAKASLHLGLARNAVEFCDTGLAKEPGDADIAKLREVCAEKLKEQQKQRAAADSAQVARLGGAGFNAEDAMALQERANGMREQLGVLQAQVQQKQRERARAQLTSDNMKDVPAETKLYAAVGRCFVLRERTVVEDGLVQALGSLDEELPRLSKAQEELAKRKEAAEQELSEMVQSYQRSSGAA